jgi:hypothetical protein
MNATPIVAALTVHAKTCAQSALSAPTTVVLKLAVGASGKVERAEIVSADGVSNDVAVCTAALAEAAKFGAPGGIGVSMMVPVELTVDAATRKPQPGDTPVDAKKADTTTVTVLPANRSSGT